MTLRVTLLLYLSNQTKKSLPPVWLFSGSYVDLNFQHLHANPVPWVLSSQTSYDTASITWLSDLLALRVTRYRCCNHNMIDWLRSDTPCLMTFHAD